MKKKGAHISVIFSKGNMDGVKNKIKQFSSEFNDNDVDVFVLNREVDGVVNGIIYVNYEKFISGYLGRFLRFYLIFKCIDFQRYDFAIIRYPLVDFSWFFLIKSMPKIYFEHHTMEVQELNSVRLNYLFKIGQVLLEKYFAPYFLKGCKGHISVTGQILNYQKKRFGLNKEYYIFSNGFNEDLYSEWRRESVLAIDEAVFKLVFIASEFKVWHGLDRLINAAASYDGSQEIEINLIGKLNESDLTCIEDFNHQKICFKVHGKLNFDQCLNVISGCNLGIDSLALDRLGFTLSSTLKSKEYVALGKPFISVTPDQDMVDYEGKIWFRPVIHQEGFELSSVIKWYETIGSDIDMPTERFSWKHKIVSLLDQLKK